jgi:hypothetical protein
MSLKTGEVETHKRAPRSNRNTQTVAWLVIFISFAIFCITLYLFISLISDYLSRSVQNQPATLQVSRGPVYISRSTQNALLVANQRDRLEQGDSVFTDEQSRALLEFFDGTKLELNSATRILVRESKILTTNFARKERRLWLHLSIATGDENRASVGRVALWPAATSGDTFTGQPVEITTDDGLKMVFDGNGKNSFIIELQRSVDGSSRTVVNSPAGNVEKFPVFAAGTTQMLEPGKRVIVDSGQPPVVTSNQQDELIRNNRAFINGLDGWEVQQKDSGNLDNVACTIFSDSEKVDDGIVYRVHTRRGIDTKDSNECSLRQELNADVSRYQSLIFSFKLKIQQQSLSGGGEQGIEFPIFVKINYIDTKGNPSGEYFAGFYTVPKDDRENTRVAKYIYSEQIKQGEWIEFISDDLLSLRSRPQKIISIQVGSAGHDFEAFFTDLSLVGKG